MEESIKISFIIMNLSVAEILMSLSDLTQNILSRHKLFPIPSTRIKYLTITQSCLFVIPSFLIMTVLAVDRFLEIYLHLRYCNLINRKKLKILLFLCWCTGFVGAAILLPLAAVGKDSATIIFKYPFPIIEGMFLMVAISSYSYIYNKFKNRNNNEIKNKNSIKSKFRKRNFFAPTLIICTFIIFVLSPDIANLFLFYITDIGSSYHANIMLLCYVIGYILDAIIYIFLQERVRRKLIKKTGSCCRSKV